MTNVILGNIRNTHLNEGFGDGNSSFKDVEQVIGPDGTIYDTKFIINAVNYSCNILMEVTQGTITKYLAALPIIYTFQIPTMATDGDYIYINPGFVMYLYETCGNYVGIAYVLMHEVYHNLFMHFQRQQADPAHFSDHTKANIAQDLEINWVIEHSFPDPRAGYTDAEVDPDDSPYDENGDPIQLFSGITEKIGGMIDSKYGNMVWEDIYDNFTPHQQKNPNQNTSNITPTTLDFDDGYRDGWNDVIREARAQGLLESIHLTIANDFIDNCIRLFEAAGQTSNDYDTGYAKGRQVALDMLKQIFDKSQKSGGSAGGSRNSASGERYHPISGLDTMKPINAPDRYDTQNNSGSGADPNKPVASQQQSMQDPSDKSSKSGQQCQSGQGQQGQDSQSGQADQQGQSGQQCQDSQSGQQGQSGQDSNGNVDGSGDDSGEETRQGNNAQSGNSNSNGDAMKKITSVEQATERLNSGKATTRVGTSDGTFTGKDTANIGDHIISKETGKKIRENGGYENNTDPNYGGKDKSPFDEGNWDQLKKDIREISNKAGAIGSRLGKSNNSRPGSGISGVFDGIIEKTDLALAPVVDWKEELRDRIDGAFMKEVDAGWLKKGIARGVYNRFSDYEGDDLSTLILMLDTSGSVFCKPEYVTQIFTEIRDIAESANPQFIDLVLFCDGIYYHEKLTYNEMPDITSIVEHNKRSGGTSYADCFRYIQKYYVEENEDFGCCIIFTDTDITYCGDQLPREQDLEWDPGYDGDKSGKLIWFVLNDNEKSLELPYGSLIETTTENFMKQIKNFNTNKSVKESVKIPRRSANNISEGYFDVPSKKILDVDSNDQLTDAKRRELSLKVINSNSETVAEYYESAKKWLMNTVGIQSSDIFIPAYAGQRLDSDGRLVNADGYNRSYFAEITKDLYINFYVKDMHISTHNLNKLKYPLKIHTVHGSFVTGGSYNATELSKGCPINVDGNFMILDMPNLVSLKNGPKTVGENYVANRCNGLESLDGAPVNFDGIFLSDGKFTNEDFAATVSNGGIMPDEQIAENISLKKKSEILESLIEEMIIMRNTYSLNESFKSNILSRILNLPDNFSAKKYILATNILWSDIPDSIITEEHTVSKIMHAMKSSCEQDRGLAICCNDNDIISFVFLGKHCIYADEHAIYSMIGTAKLVCIAINDRVAYPGSDDLFEKTHAIEYCEHNNIPIQNKTVQRVARNWETVYFKKSQSSIKISDLYLVPNLCSKTYIIKDTDPNGEYNIDNLYSKRTGIQDERKNRVAGTRINPKYLNPKDNVPYTKKKYFDDPFYNRYKNYLIDPETIFTNKHNLNNKNVAIITLERVKESMKINNNTVRSKLIEYYNSGKISEEILDKLYKWFIYTDYNKTVKRLDSDIESIKSILNKYIFKSDIVSGKTKDYDSSDVYNTVKTYKDDPGTLTAQDAIHNNNVGGFCSNWYYYYINTIKEYAELLGALERYVKTGNDDLLQKFL